MPRAPKVVRFTSLAEFLVATNHGGSGWPSSRAFTWPGWLNAGETELRNERYAYRGPLAQKLLAAAADPLNEVSLWLKLQEGTPPQASIGGSISRDVAMNEIALSLPERADLERQLRAVAQGVLPVRELRHERVRIEKIGGLRSREAGYVFHLSGDFRPGRALQRWHESDRYNRVNRPSLFVGDHRLEIGDWLTRDFVGAGQAYVLRYFYGETCIAEDSRYIERLRAAGLVTPVVVTRESGAQPLPAPAKARRSKPAQPPAGSFGLAVRISAILATIGAARDLIEDLGSAGQEDPTLWALDSAKGELAAAAADLKVGLPVHPIASRAILKQAGEALSQARIRIGGTFAGASLPEPAIAVIMQIDAAHRSIAEEATAPSAPPGFGVLTSEMVAAHVASHEETVEIALDTIREVAVLIDDLAGDGRGLTMSQINQGAETVLALGNAEAELERAELDLAKRRAQLVRADAALAQAKAHLASYRIGDAGLAGRVNVTSAQIEAAHLAISEDAG